MEEKILTLKDLQKANNALAYVIQYYKTSNRLAIAIEVCINHCNRYNIELVSIIKKFESVERILKHKTSSCWLDLKAASNYTSLSESTIRRAIQKGALKASTSTGKLLFKVSDVDRWLNG